MRNMDMFKRLDSKMKTGTNGKYRLGMNSGGLVLIQNGGVGGLRVFDDVDAMIALMLELSRVGGNIEASFDKNLDFLYSDIESIEFKGRMVDLDLSGLEYYSEDLPELEELPDLDEIDSKESV